jgi:hypothetical protein
MTDLAIGFVHPLMVNAHFMRSVIEASRYEQNCDVLSVMSGPNVSTGRNLLVRHFLDKSDADWLFMVDTDMVFKPDAISRLIESGEPIVSGVYLTGGDHPTPCMYRRCADAGPGQFMSIAKWEPGELISADVVGTGCVLVHRDVFVDIEKKIPNRAAQWFQEVQMGDSLVGEDFVFFMRAEECGWKLLVDTRVYFGHVKGSIIGQCT